MPHTTVVASKNLIHGLTSERDPYVHADPLFHVRSSFQSWGSSVVDMALTTNVVSVDVRGRAYQILIQLMQRRADGRSILEATMTKCGLMRAS